MEACWSESGNINIFCGIVLYILIWDLGGVSRVTLLYKVSHTCCATISPNNPRQVNKELAWDICPLQPILNYSEWRPRAANQRSGTSGPACLCRIIYIYIVIFTIFIRHELTV